MKKLGLVGVGAIAQSYFSALEGADFARISAVADLNGAAVATAAETLGCAGFSSYEQMADQADCDAVIICTPPSTHAKIAQFFINGGVPVLCEKPLALDSSSAAAIMETAKRKGVLATMASKFRYVEDVIRAKAIIGSGLLGEVKILENAFVSRVDMSKRWNSDLTVGGGGVIIDNGTHSVDIIRYLLGPITRVMTVDDGSRNEGRVEQNGFMLLETESGVSARVDLSWSFDKQLPEYLRIYGTEGSVHVGWAQSKYKQTGNSNWIKFGKGYDKISAFRNQLRNFCAAVDGGEPSLVSVSDALASVHVIQAAYESAKRGGWADVHQEPFGNFATYDDTSIEAAE